MLDGHERRATKHCSTTVRHTHATHTTTRATRDAVPQITLMCASKHNALSRYMRWRSSSAHWCGKWATLSTPSAQPHTATRDSAIPRASVVSNQHQRRYHAHATNACLLTCVMQSMCTHTPRQYTARATRAATHASGALTTQAGTRRGRRCVHRRQPHHWQHLGWQRHRAQLPCVRLHTLAAPAAVNARRLQR